MLRYAVPTDEVAFPMLPVFLGIYILWNRMICHVATVLRSSFFILSVSDTSKNYCMPLSRDFREEELLVAHRQNIYKIEERVNAWASQKSMK